ncbi:hypothetical protein J7E62_27695 [Variovorax paradoxus]|nr:hypothetical protein [Variovorax paradoxus]
MAGLTKEQRAERQAPETAKAAVDEGLVTMTKAGEEIAVHPTCVKSHQAAGWKLKD